MSGGGALAEFDTCRDWSRLHRRSEVLILIPVFISRARSRPRSRSRLRPDLDPRQRKSNGKERQRASVRNPVAVRFFWGVGLFTLSTTRGRLFPLFHRCLGVSRRFIANSAI